MSTFVCPICLTRWKITQDGETGDRWEYCLPCKGQIPEPTLWPQTFNDVCPPPKDAA